MIINNYLIVTLFIAILGISYAIFNFFKVKKVDEGTDEMAEIALAIRTGASTFLKSEYKVLILVVIGIAVLQAIFIFIPSSVSFMIGAFMSALAGFFGMKMSTYANVRVTNTAKETGGIGRTLKIALRGGSIMGLSVASFSLIGIVSVFFLYGSYLYDMNTFINWCGIGFTPMSMILTSYALGCSIVAMFNRVGGGIYTKAADMGADLVGKNEENIPEDDRRNPAVIADCVGDNVGDTAGLGSDLLESNVGAIVSAIITPIFLYIGFQTKGLVFSKALLEIMIIYPIAFVSLGLVSSIIGLMFVFIKNARKKPHRALNIGTWLTAGLTGVSSYFLTHFMFFGADLGDLPFALGYISPWLAAIVGIICGVLVGMTAEYYTSYDYNPTKKIVEASKTGTALTITQGISCSMKSTLVACIILGIGVFLSSQIAGIYGIAMAAIGMLSFVAITVSVDTYGPISDNAGGIAEMAHLDADVRKITDKLDSVGNTTAAVGKGFAIGSATFATISLLNSYMYSFTSISSDVSLNVISPEVFFGIIVGGSIICYFSGMLIEAVSNAAEKMVSEVRRQFNEIEGLREGLVKPDYESCIKISTNGALSGMKTPAIIAVMIPIIGGFIFGPLFVGGLLFGAIIAATLLGIFYGNSGGAWDNSKKYIEALGLKGTDQHIASVVGDTVGDPLKDTAGPSLNIFIKIMNTISLVCVCFFKDFYLLKLFF